ncbi:MAG: hypothetical protein RBQ79_02185, partial [Sphaerochaetaceae bacterium]|nr:hypothetical protein [Sphaerochaetaceae bacterium]
NHEFSSEQIITSLNKANVDELNESTFKTLHYSRVLQRLHETFAIDFGKNIYTRSAIRKMLAATKKKN